MTYTFREFIEREVNAGSLQTEFSAQDLKARVAAHKGALGFQLATINSRLATSGDWLRKGSGRSLYRLAENSLSQDQQDNQKIADESAGTSERLCSDSSVSSNRSQDDSAWSTSKGHVKSFIDWIVKKEVCRQFCFQYDLEGKKGGERNKLEADSIYSAARMYSWKTNSIPQELIKTWLPMKKPSSNLEGTCELLLLMRRELRDSLEDGDALRHLKVCWAVLYWGGVASPNNLSFYALRYFSGCSDQESKNSLINYHKTAHNVGGWFGPGATDEVKVQKEVAAMSAGITKIHSLLADELVIYDSRVACALAWLVERYCEDPSGGRGLKQIPNELKFCIPQEKQGKKKVERQPEAVRSANGSAIETEYRPIAPKRDYRLWTRDMLRASLILAKVLEQIKNADVIPGNEIQRDFLEYQLGLFMIGYHLTDHRVLM